MQDQDGVRMGLDSQDGVGPAQLIVSIKFTGQFYLLFSLKRPFLLAKSRL